MNLLIEGWFNIPHSYANVACFEMFAMYKLFSNEIKFYIKEREYFCKNWKKTNVLPEHYANVLFNPSIFKPYSENQKIDIIYRIIFPYDISIDNKNIHIPKCIFYTSEYAMLTPDYFMNKNGRFSDMSVLKKYLHNFRYNLYFTCPSKWSSLGLEKIDSTSKNKIITHGVDTSIFYKDDVSRKKVRNQYSVLDSEILLMNIGAMSSNKGIVFILLALIVLVRNGFKNVKLFIKGIANLYQTTTALQECFAKLETHSSKEECEYIMKNHLVITYDTLDFNQMKDLYNACDLYVSPYVAEGFNLTPLEALACGCNVAVSSTGSTQEYIDDIFNHGGSNFIHKIKSNVIEADSKMYNQIDINDLIQIIHRFIKNNNRYDNSEMISYIQKEYSWDKVAKLKIDYFKEILSSV